MEKQVEQLKEYQSWAKDELRRAVDFWLKNGMDPVNGGVYTCLDREGKIYSTDKSVWMQGRCGWIFSYLCHVYGKKQEWMEAAQSCLDFMEKYCINREAGNRMYFTVTADGRPLRQRRYCFSEGFYCMANAEYFGLTNDKQYIERARAAYELIYQLNHRLIQDPTGLGPKTIPTTRSGRSLADPMIYLNITSIMRRCDPENKALYDQRAEECCKEILTYHYKPELGCLLETVGLDGEVQSECTAGRMVDPGHDIECAWFMLEEANYLGSEMLHAKAQNIFDQAFEHGWDKEYEGLLYFIDCMGMPPEAYEHDMKLWWPQNELMIAAMMLYRDLGDEKYLKIFDKTLNYCKRVFCDPQYGEWYGYLRRDGKPTMPPCKGSTFKGPFHVLRMLIMVDCMIDEILKRESSRASM
ncbi:AGE family epimerase/isomerase [Ruthenibacterium sp. CLA-JM-H11]|uniref:AGE family epimerase/isomerase n=1 Tax=Ruthenibacterium intestinale TaxID=3133163 RepID=A0ABV1GE12_9FIRM